MTIYSISLNKYSSCFPFFCQAICINMWGGIVWRVHNHQLFSQQHNEKHGHWMNINSRGKFLSLSLSSIFFWLFWTNPKACFSPVESFASRWTFTVDLHRLSWSNLVHHVVWKQLQESRSQCSTSCSVTRSVIHQLSNSEHSIKRTGGGWAKSPEERRYEKLETNSNLGYLVSKYTI